MKTRVHLRTPRADGTQYADLQELVYDPQKKRSVWKFKEYLGKVVGKDDGGNWVVEKKTSRFEEVSLWEYLLSATEEKTPKYAKLLASVLSGLPIEPSKKRTSKEGVARMADRYIYFYKSLRSGGVELCIDVREDGQPPEVSILDKEDAEARNNADFEIAFQGTAKSQSSSSRMIPVSLGKPTGAEARELCGHFVSADPKFDSAIRLALAFQELLDWLERKGANLGADPDRASELISATLVTIKSIPPIFSDSRLALICRVLFEGGSIYLDKGKVVQAGFSFGR